MFFSFSQSGVYMH